MLQLFHARTNDTPIAPVHRGLHIALDLTFALMLFGDSGTISHPGYIYNRFHVRNSAIAALAIMVVAG
ncbi:uncharacterized protein N7477_005120 [Penicillium maclennaniae]|uniref:uncharacterized protein n=1 Tax=Penicillium maclennaniae TaxID=1343394 RepID=UPI002540E5F6|nr:uncharacterized protein N7477_005120 [Penicillium maclennaniae]KAJ5675186.1 hypothetical protein N7477_005120 [Penicillium maclennaniae]